MVKPWLPNKSKNFKDGSLNSKKKTSYLKSDCHLHIRLRQQLEAAHKLRFQHGMKILCRVLVINRSTYYKHYNSVPTDRTRENQLIASKIVHIFTHYNKQLGAYKITHILRRDYSIHISPGQVYLMMKSLQLPKMSTPKPFHPHKHNENGQCTNHLQQDFNQKAPNLV